MSKHDLSQLSLAGFQNPNNFNISHLQELIMRKSFPEKNELMEYCWAINESDIGNVELNIQTYIIIVFLYSYRQTECINALDEIYFYLFTKNCLKFKKQERKLFIEFLLNLKNDISYPDEIPPNNDLFLLLSILVITNSIHYNESQNILIKIRKSHKELKFEKLSIYGDFLERWIELLEKDINDEDMISKCIDILTSPN